MEDRQGAVDMMHKSGQNGVPVLDINGSIVVGFDRDEISRILGL
jgi:glutaredoxin